MSLRQILNIYTPILHTYHRLIYGNMPTRYIVSLENSVHVVEY